LVHPCNCSISISTWLLICFLFFDSSPPHRALPSFPTRRSSDLGHGRPPAVDKGRDRAGGDHPRGGDRRRRVCPHCRGAPPGAERSEEHTSELQSRENLVCRLLLEKKNKKEKTNYKNIIL